jgi:beta-glucosidase
VSREALETMTRLRAANIPVVAVMLTGRPLFAGPQLNAANAFVVAWLPGSEGAGVADRLFGARGGAATFSGRLPMAWPASARADGPVLFARGFGLDGGRQEWTPVPEEPGTDAGARGNAFFVDGRPDARTSLVIGDGKSVADKVMLVPTTGANGRIAVRAVDDRVQEGARAFDLRGGGAQQVSLDLDAPADLTLPAFAGSMMVVRIRLDGAPAADIRIGARCDQPCDQKVALPLIPTGAWTTVGIPLKCFGPVEALRQVKSPFVLRSAGTMRFSMAEVAVGAAADHVATCS